MNKSLIIKYIDGLCSPSENEEVVSWIEADKRNRAYFEELRTLIVKTRLASADSRFNVAAAPTMRVRTRKWANRIIGGIAAAACIGLVISVLHGAYLKKRLLFAQENPVEVIKVLDGESLRDMRTVVYRTEKGVRGNVVLPDGSKVTLSSDSRLEVPEAFSGKYRELNFSGEAFFDVVTNKDFPMIVNTTNGTIEVLGTKFNVRSYEEDGTTAATLLSGKIKIKSRDERYGDNYILELNPEETAILHNNKALKRISHVDTMRTLAWKDGRLIFDSTPMSSVIKELERWHGCSFVVQDSSVFNYSITAKFESCTITDIMEMIRFCSPVDYRKSDNMIYLSTRK